MNDKNIINKRLWKELEEINNSNSNEFIAGPKNVEDMYNWQATIVGPKSSPYEEGIFKLDIIFPYEYPFKPPKVTFNTLIFHPAINFEGIICMDILINKWNPTFYISKVLNEIIDLLDKPSNKVPFVPQIAVILNEDREVFNEKAKEWTSLYAKPIQ